MRLSRKGYLFLFIVFITVFLFSCNSNVKAEKPVIYLYPTQEEVIDVKLEYKGDLTITYPEYKDGWTVKAKPDGTLINLEDNREYAYLFWEGISSLNYDISEGFVVKNEDTMDFLQKKLEYIGLTPKEYNEFIVYWLPILQENKYNLIYFAGEEYDEYAKLNISPKPDSILRVMMVFKPLDKPIEIKEQKLEQFNREGFTVVEWGGTKVDK